jgi:hypothetical protein
MAEHLHDAPARRAAEDRRAQRTMIELRWMYGDMHDTQPVELEARTEPTTPIQRMVAWLRKTTRMHAR